jgi:hypothetical protein
LTNWRNYGTEITEKLSSVKRPAATETRCECGEQQRHEWWWWWLCELDGTELPAVAVSSWGPETISNWQTAAKKKKKKRAQQDLRTNIQDLIRDLLFSGGKDVHVRLPG